MNFIKRNMKNIIIIVLSVLFLLACVVIYVLANKNNLSNELKTITGSVIIADKSYVIVETDVDDYLVKDIKGNYNIGDEVKFTYYTDDINNEDSLKTINLIYDEELLNRLNNDRESNDKNLNNNKNNTTNSGLNNNNKDNNSSNKNNNNNTNNINNNSFNNSSNTNSSSNENTNADVQVLNYFSELNNDFDSGSIKDSLKNGFITVVDFLFYKGKIKGHTFDDLTDSAKLKVLSMALYFDTKIDTYFPGYKESISNSTSKIYTTVKEEIVSNYLQLATMVCNKDAELCDSAKLGFENIKEKFGLSWALIKDIAGDGLNNLKNWYEIWSGK
ncbi:MAG: hypothetical protein E7163_01255 [Firmicutes bacterium]|nr:hypothetical protein [Bacillota bacterium]